MRAVIQRVRRASVRSEGRPAGTIGHGLLILVGVENGDADGDAEWLGKKCAELRIFENEEGRFDRSVKETGGEALVVSQFTVLGDCSRGRRPDFARAARPEEAEPLIDRLIACLRKSGLSVASGVFRTRMDVDLVNEGPVTVILDSRGRP
jgi:D-tyrosyl-tRNA(Tyr) deacylase